MNNIITTGIAATARKMHLSKSLVAVLGAAVLTMAGAGAAAQAAAGDVKITGEPSGLSGSMDVTVAQGLTIVGGSMTGVAAGRVITSDDGTVFMAPAEVFTGDRFTVNIALGNKSERALEAQITVEAPEGMRVEVKGSDGAAGVVRTANNTWTFRLAGAETDEIPDLAITVSVSGTTELGAHPMKIAIEPLKW